MTTPAARTGLAIEHVPGGPIIRERRPGACAMVIFGATGDLTARKLAPALYNLMVEEALPERFAVLAVGRREYDDDAFRESLREQVERFSRRALDPDLWSRFAAAIEYVQGEIDDPRLYVALGEALGRAGRRGGTGGGSLYYLATPPELFPVILGRLADATLIQREPRDASPWCRVIIEKPFGQDLDSARALNQLVARYLREHQTFRIDHYLGKETVQNILVLRLANSIFEPLWNRKAIDHVQITAAESIGVEGRGRFYDKTGVMRDIVQNHLLQVLALIAMEPPASFAADAIRDEKVKVLGSIRAIAGREIETHLAFGQYAGYRDEEGVAPGSRTPTFVAMKLMIDNWRWQGVPFYIRAGKGLAGKVTEISVQFQDVPLCVFPQEETCQRLAPNVLTIRVQPDEGIALRFMAKVPGEHVEVGNVLMTMRYSDAFQTPIAEAYERLLLDAMRGDTTLYSRRDGVERAWKLVTPIVAAQESVDGPAPETYARGSTGPQAAEELLLRDGRRWGSLVTE